MCKKVDVWWVLRNTGLWQCRSEAKGEEMMIFQQQSFSFWTITPNWIVIWIVLLLTFSQEMKVSFGFLPYWSRKVPNSLGRRVSPNYVIRGLHEKRKMSSNDDLIADDHGRAIPTSFKSRFLNVLLERGFIHQCTDFHQLDERLTQAIIPAYLGFDATASSLHVGSLLQIMILRHLQKCGHKPVVLVGGGTTKVGDPTGKDESRKLLSDETITNNIDSIKSVFQKFLHFGDGPTDAILVNNADWLDRLNYLQFLRDYGRLFTVNRMLTFESVKQRLQREQPLTFLEFNYLLLQSYDFVELFRRYQVQLQLGGSDQWGNIVSGVELGRKLSDVKKPLFGLTAPLMTTSDGKKMGKTASGAVWLNKELLSEYDYWQFWRNTADADVIRFLKLFTEVPMSQIVEYEKLEGSELNAVKRVVADEATALLHGRDCLHQIHSTVDSLFANRNGGSNEDLGSLPQISLTPEDLSSANEGTSELSLSVADALVKVGMTKSKNESRRLIKAGGVKVNDQKIDNEYHLLLRKDFNIDGKLKLSSGKKKNSVLLWPQ